MRVIVIYCIYSQTKDRLTVCTLKIKKKVRCQAMTARKNSTLNAEAEMIMMGYTLPIHNEEHLRYLVGYILYVLQPQYHYNLEEKTEEVVNNALHKYNSENLSVKYLTTNTAAFGTLLTFVRDDEPVTSEYGVLTWCENLDYPDCSELGYSYFANENGKLHRIA